MYNGGGLRKKLRDGNSVLGSIMYLGVPAYVELAADIGFEWLFVDCEHGPDSNRGLVPLLTAAKGTPLDMIVRVSGLHAHEVKYALDMGASGIIVPMMESAAQVRTLVEWCRYRPEGKRGFGPLRPSRYFRENRQYFKQANDLVTVIAMIESVDAIEQIDKITSVPGLDGVFMGTDDLRLTMGTLCKPDPPEFSQNIEKVFAAASRAGIAFGTYENEVEKCLAWIKKGARLMTLGSDLDYWCDGMERHMSGMRRGGTHT